MPYKALSDPITYCCSTGKKRALFQCLHILHSTASLTRQILAFSLSSSHSYHQLINQSFSLCKSLFVTFSSGPFWGHHLLVILTCGSFSSSPASYLFPHHGFVSSTVLPDIKCVFQSQILSLVSFFFFFITKYLK